MVTLPDEWLASDALAIHLAMPWTSGADICPVCRGVIYEEQADRCLNCVENETELATLTPIVPISLYSKPSQLRDWLTFYKSGPDHLADAGTGAAIASILRRFSEVNRSWFAGLALDEVVVVPSTDRPPPHPLEALLRTAAPQLPLRSTLLRTREPLGHNHPNRHAFETRDDVAGARILLIDDVYTSGARGQSAAHALTTAGATVVAFLVIGRRFNPDYSQRATEVMRQARSTPFEWSIQSRDLIRRQPAG